MHSRTLWYGQVNEHEGEGERDSDRNGGNKRASERDGMVQ